MAPNFDPKLQSLLAKTSRTFALSIPIMSQPLRQQVTLAYLVLRVADTLEDGEFLDRQTKAESLARLENALLAIDCGSVCDHDLQLPKRPTANSAYLELLDEVPFVLQRVSELDSEARHQVIAKARTSVEGMRDFVALGNDQGAAQIQSFEELRRYCYVVAGVVGEMLTELFLISCPSLESVATDLRHHARWFGEGLQLVNILKDSDDDARFGRRFIPPHVSRESLYELAREDLVRAETYIDRLRAGGASSQVIAFCELPVKLASRTLECIESHGPGAKVSRSELMMIVTRTLAATGLEAMQERFQHPLLRRAEC